MNPYLILDVPDDAADEAIRSAYLTQLRRHSPDTDPEGFGRVQTAYQSIKDIEARCQWWFFTKVPVAESPIALLVEREQSRPHPARPWQELRAFLRHNTTLR
jgi:DnaJ domain